MLTEGSPDSIFATRDWLELISFAISTWVIAFFSRSDLKSFAQCELQFDVRRFLIRQLEEFLGTANLPALPFQPYLFSLSHRRNSLVCVGTHRSSPLASVQSSWRTQTQSRLHRHQPGTSLVTSSSRRLSSAHGNFGRSKASVWSEAC